jgi:hypothetical protein
MGTTLNPISVPQKTPIKANRQQSDQFTQLALEVYHRYQQLCLRRDGWRNIFMLLSKYLRMRPVWFGDTGVPWRTPRLSVINVSDDTAVDMANTCAIALGGALWPNISESFEVVLQVPPEAMSDMYDQLQSDELKNYEQECTRKARGVVDHPNAGFLIALGECLKDDVDYGTAGINGEEQDGRECPVHYRSISIETAVIDEGKNKLVDTVFFEFAYTAKEMVNIYGGDNVSDRTQELYDADLYDDYIKVIHAVYPRPKNAAGYPTKEGEEIENKPYASVHFEFDTKWVIKESGMDELTAFVTRFTKCPNELYGRGLGLAALPSIKEMNVNRKAFSVAELKNCRPPLGYYQDQIGGGGQVDISEGAQVPLFTTGRVPQNTPPIIRLIDHIDTSSMEQRIEKLAELIGGKFLLDKLLDFNNKTRMTAEETRERSGFRDQVLSPIFSRFFIEILYPILMFTLKVMNRKSLLGLHPVKDAREIQQLTADGITPFVMPALVAKMIDRGFFPFGVRFVSPAARAMRADSLTGLEQLTNYTMAWAKSGHPEASDNLDIDAAVREYQHLSGAPIKVMRANDSLKKVRKQSALMQQQQMALQQGEIKATIAQKGATAAKNYANAQQHGGQGMPNIGGDNGQGSNAA